MAQAPAASGSSDETPGAVLVDQGPRMEGRTPIFSFIPVGELISAKLKYDSIFDEYVIEVEKKVIDVDEPSGPFVRGVSLDVDRMVDFVDYAEDLVQGILARGGAVNRAVRIHLGFRIYLTYDYYEGDGLFSIRQYYLIEGKEVAGKKGVSLRCGNFSKLIRSIQGQLAIGVKIKLRNLFLVENSIELVLRKRVLARAKRNCNACRQGFRVTHPEHQVGCLLGWAHIVQEQLVLAEHLPDLATEAEAVYKAALTTLAFDDTKGALAHAFGYLYGKYFTNDAGTIFEEIKRAPFRASLETDEQKMLEALCAAAHITESDLSHFERA